ncbi:hypothetical protein WJ63_30145 [Burkholderia pyrrocinia]|nr:hypothetical protein WJ63_30145 [Burkholderia pyrrocinia]
MKQLKVYVVIALTGALAACGKHAGDEYLGTWKSASGAGPDYVVERNGDGFIVSHTVPNLNATSETDPHALIVRQPAVADGDQLVVSDAMGGDRMAIDRKTGHLLFGPEELVKAR